MVGILKKLARSVVFNFLALGVVSVLIPGVVLGGLETWIPATLVFGFVNYFIKPVLKIITFPINFMTFGLFSFVLNSILLYATAFLVPGFSIRGFHFEGLSLGSLTLSSMEIPTLGTALIASFLISLALTLLRKIFD